jgi:glyoxylase-like metal-dependent hydrolase (beta-lactamase superfamily II)
MLALTHAHPDHQGVAKDVCEARGVPLACHADDVEAMEGKRPMQEASAGNLVNEVIRTAPPSPTSPPSSASSPHSLHRRNQARENPFERVGEIHRSS